MLSYVLTLIDFVLTHAAMLPFPWGLLCPHLAGMALALFLFAAVLFAATLVKRELRTFRNG